MGQKAQNQNDQRDNARIESEKFCTYACVNRFLKSKGDNVKKTAKQIRTCLTWRESIGNEHLTADEFSSEIAEGLAYVAGHDDESRPVMVLRMKQEYHKSHSQKLFVRLFAFTLEVAISTMPRNVEKFVMLFDASYYRSASVLMNVLVGALKIVGEYYPGRLHKAFVIDPPSLFTYMWKGVRPFVELSAMTMVVSSLDFEESLEFNNFTAHSRSSSIGFSPSIENSTARIGSCSSQRFAFTVPHSHQFDSLKPWYLSLANTSASRVGPTSPSPLGPALISPLNARSLSFASPVGRMPRGDINGPNLMRKSSLPSTPLSQRVTTTEATKGTHKRRPSFLQSPAMFFRKDKESHAGKNDKSSKESFLPFLRFYRRPYDEMIYSVEASSFTKQWPLGCHRRSRATVVAGGHRQSGLPVIEAAVLPFAFRSSALVSFHSFRFRFDPIFSDSISFIFVFSLQFDPTADSSSIAPSDSIEGAEWRSRGRGWRVWKTERFVVPEPPPLKTEYIATMAKGSDEP
ncbi:Sec14p-like phosphatidylinositol transfer family protein isoform 1 [Senna tora]|uniref:Sec14p-like phosphatidylinositol transfer family protein isoform 1 n=1 Tax=Senna tora TaxID=362788 RepID=A0A834W2Y0_9FABA|nr:Sec14p-like phosphatidylinositol transfer family protein isoform 1 [Senna tora]